MIGAVSSHYCDIFTGELSDTNLVVLCQAICKGGLFAVEVKLSPWQAVENHKAIRRRRCHIF
jgi:hypothetical protein